MKKKNKKLETKYNSIDLNEFIAVYFYEIKRCLEEIDKTKIAQSVDILMEAYRTNRKVFILGNGGSATTASHMACDLGKGTVRNRNNEKEKRFQVISLADNIAVMTALANDVSFGDIFVEQLKNLMEKDDVVLVISGSGNSENVIKAVEYARKHGAKTIGMLGFKTGGKLAQKVDCAIIVDSSQYGPIEDIHVMLNHLIASWIAKINNGQSNKEGMLNENTSVPFR